MSFAVDQNF